MCEQSVRIASALRRDDARTKATPEITTTASALRATAIKLEENLEKLFEMKKCCDRSSDARLKQAFVTRNGTHNRESSYLLRTSQTDSTRRRVLLLCRRRVMWSSHTQLAKRHQPPQCTTHTVFVLPFSSVTNTNHKNGETCRCHIV